MIYGRKEENVVGSKVGAFGKVVIFSPSVYVCSHSPFSLEWNVCSIESGHGSINIYLFGEAALGLRGKGTGESNECDLVPGPDTEPDQ